MGGLMMPVETANRLQVVCIVGLTDAHSSPDHTTRRVDVEWNSLGPHATLLMHPSGPTGSVLVLRGLIGLIKGHLEKQTFLSIPMGLIHYFYAHIILFNSPRVLGSKPCYVLFANGAGGVEYFFHRVFQPVLATPLLDNKVNAFQYIYE